MTECMEVGARGVPIFAVAEDAADGKLPAIWITARATAAEGPYDRTCIMRYPDESYDDVDGREALWRGGEYYEEGMEYSDDADRRARIDCFKATELLYLHAAACGNPYAYLCLGYVYSYDRCQGEYWTGSGAPVEVADGCEYPREERAFECYRRAAEAGYAQAWYRVGDMLRDGVGCEPDSEAAFESYMKAVEADDGRVPHIWGSIALRLGECYEDGVGCAQSFEKALDWYEKAETGLELDVRAGDSWYGPSLRRARNGITRCKQELDGRY